MNFKRIILISLILCFLSMACVSANENQTLTDSSLNDVQDMDNFDAIKVADENTNNEDIAVNGDNENIYGNDGVNVVTGHNSSDEQDVVFDEVLSSSNNDVLAASNEGTRDELNNLIIVARPGSTITLDKDYRFETGVKTIEITKNIIIDGKGHTIRLGYNPAFTFKCISPAGKIEIKNITFFKGIGSAIHFTEDSCPFIISNCTFINCSANDGGAILGRAKYNSYIIDCSFKGCHGYGESKVVRKETLGTIFSGSFSSGGALWISGSVIVKSSRFEECSAGDGGAISVYDNCQIIDCEFVGNKAGRIDSLESFEHGGAIRIKGGSGALIKGCTFNNNHAGRYGGAISSFGNNVKIEDCLFSYNYLDNSIRQEGGAIFVSADSLSDESPIQISRCSFSNNGYNNNDHYCKYGGAIYFNNGIVLGSVSNCNFTNNGASKGGGAIYASSNCRSLTFSNCLFTRNNIDKYGGAIYLDSKSSTIFQCAFVDQPNAVYCDNKKCDIKFSTFLRNNNYDIWSTKQINIVNNWFGNTMDNRYANLAKLKGKAIITNFPENLYLVATPIDKNYYNGQESYVNLNLKYIRESPTETSKLPSSAYHNPLIRYVVSGVNATVNSSNLYLGDGKSTFKFRADISKKSCSLTVDCYSAFITLRFGFNSNSFTALQALVDSCQNGVLNLTHNYTRDKSTDGDRSISILKNLVINGNGFTVDSKNGGGVFKIDNISANVEFNNLNIVNCQSTFGAAICAYANNVVVNNCTFINSTTKFDGGAIKINGNGLTLTNSTFINNIANEKGGSIFLIGSNKSFVIRDCIFINSTAVQDGSFIYVDVYSKLNLSNSIFLTNSATRYIGKPSGDRPVTFNIENNWFGGTDDYILRNYHLLNNITVKNLLYLNATASVDDILVGNSSNISLKFYSYDVNTNKTSSLSNFRNMKFNLKLLGQGGTLSSDSIMLTNNEGSVLYTSSSNGLMPVEINYELFNHRVYLNQYYDGSFTALQLLINGSGDVINLTRDYTFSQVSDSQLAEGIFINKNLTINGNGHIINGDGKARIFNISDCNVVLNNITFINGFADDGGAVVSSVSTYLTIDSCRFENNSAKNGGAIYLKSYYFINIGSSIFKNNSATANGGAIYYHGYSRSATLYNISGTFINNRASDEGGAIYLIDVGRYNLKGNFTNNSAGRNGGAVCSDTSLGIPNFSIDGVFNSNTASYGGAVYSYNPYGNFTGVYHNNRASKDGGAIYLSVSSSRYGMPNNISGEFYSNTANGQGSALYAKNLKDRDIDLYESLFVNNSGNSTVYSSGYMYIKVYDSIFIDNVNVKILDTSNETALDGGIKAYNNWFGNTIDNFNKKPSVGSRVKLNNWLFLDVDCGKLETYLNSNNNIVFMLKEYDGIKKIISDCMWDRELNLSLKSNAGNFSNDSLILDNLPVRVTYVPNVYGASNILVYVNFSKYSYKAYEFNYNVVEYPTDSFYKLQYEIDHMEGNILNLTKDYEFYVGIDSPSGIKINKSLTINGNGFKIDGKGGSRIFNILADDVLLENISLVNGNDINGSAIYAEGSNIVVRNSIFLNNFDNVIYATKPLNANYNWWGNTAETFNKKANVSSNVILDNALFMSFNAVSNIVEAGKNTTLILNLSNLYDFNLESNSTYNGLNYFSFDFNATGGDINLTSNKLNKGIISLSFYAVGPLYAEIFASYEDVKIKYEFEVVYDDDSFTALYVLINNTSSGGIVNLTHDYRFYYYDVDYVNGISIDKPLTILGNGFDISGVNESSIFTVSADNVILTNINLYDGLKFLEWDGNNGLIANVSFNNSYAVLDFIGSNLTITTSNFTGTRLYSLYLKGSNILVDNCIFKDNSACSIFAQSIDNLTIISSVFANISSSDLGIIELGSCNNVELMDCTFNNQINRSINIWEGSTVYLFNNTLGESEYIFNNGTIVSRTFVSLDDVDLSYMVGDVLLLNATIYDDNGNIILIDEFYFNIGDDLQKASLNSGVYEYSWILTNGSWLVVPLVDENSFTDCVVDSVLVNVLKYNSSVNITSIEDIIYGEDAFIEFEFENSTEVLVKIFFGSDVVFSEVTSANNISISGLESGYYDVIITTLENEFYLSSSAHSGFFVERAGSSLSIKDFDNIYYGEDLIINFTVENRTVVVASVYDIDSGEFIFNGDIEGDSLIINELPVGSYSITLTNIIGPNYNPSGDFALFNVFKVNSSISLDGVGEYVYGNVTVNYDVDNLTEIFVSIVDLNNGDMYNFTTVNSSVILDLDAGIYEITLLNMETSNVFASEDSKVFYVVPANSSVEISEIDNIYYGEDIEILFELNNATNVTVTVRDEYGNIVFYENGTEETYFDLSDLNVGHYMVEVYYEGSNNFNPSMDTELFDVLKTGSMIEFDYNNLTEYGISFILDYDVENETLLNIRIYDDMGEVIFDKNFDEISPLPDEVSNLTEDAYLGFNFFIYRNLSVGNYTFEFTNLGNSNVGEYIVYGSFEVIKASSYVEIFVDSIVYGEDLKVQISVVNTTIVNVLIIDSDGLIVYDENVTSTPVVISNLLPGNYTVVVTNYDTLNIIGNSSSEEFSVYKVNSAVKLNNISDIYYEDVVLIDFEVDNRSIVNVMVQNQDGVVFYDGNVTFDMLLIPNLDVGYYTVNITNLETFNITASSDSKSFRVFKKSINISVVVEDSVYGELSVVNLFSDIDGIFTVNIGTQELLVSSVGGYGKSMIGLDAGNYTAYVNYTNNNYDINMTNSSFTVSKANMTLSVEVLDKVYTADVVGNVFASVDGEYTVLIGGIEVPVNVLEGIGSFNLGVLDAGNYTLGVIFNGSKNYNSNYNETTFEIALSGTNFNILANGTNISYGNSINITHSLPADATGNVTYFFANGTVIKILDIGESFIMPILDAGSYVLYANYSGDSNHAPAEDSLTIIVNKLVNHIIVSADNVTYLENSTLTVVADVDGVYGVDIRGIIVLVDVLDGIGFNTIALDAGNYSASVEYINPNYVNVVTSIPFSVKKADVDLSVEVLDVVYSADVEGNVFASADGEYYVIVGDILKLVIVKEGIGSFNLGILDAGNYGVHVLFMGNNNFNANSNVSTFRVNATFTNFNIVASSGVITYGELINITQILPVAATGNVTYMFANKTLIDVLNVNGSFVLSGLNAGSYVIYGYYSGDSNYASAMDSLTIVVNRAVNNVVVSVSNVTYPDIVEIIVEADIDGLYNVSVGSNFFEINVVNGSGSVNASLAVGNYSTFTCFEDSNFELIVEEAIFSVLPIGDYNFTVKMIDRTVYFYGPEDASGNVTLVVANATYIVYWDNGKANVTVNELIEGSNFAEIAYSGDSKYASRSFETYLIVNTTIVASDMSRGYNSGVDYYVKIVDSDGNLLSNKTVTFTVNNKDYVAVTGDDGVAKLNAKFAVGTYTVTVTLDGGKNLTKKFSIVKRITGNKNVVKYYNSNFKYKFKIIGDDGKAVGKGVKVTVRLANKKYNLKTDKKGYITIRLTKKYAPKKYTLRTSYKGYSIKNTINIKNVISIKKTVSVRKSAAKFVLTAKLKEGKKALKYKRVTFKFAGRKYAVKTSKKGIATVTFNRNFIAKLVAGKKYKFTVTYLKSTVTGKVSVKR